MLRFGQSQFSISSIFFSMFLRIDPSAPTMIDITVTFIFSYVCEFLSAALADGSLWSMSERKSPQVSMILFILLANQKFQYFRWSPHVLSFRTTTVPRGEWPWHGIT